MTTLIAAYNSEGCTGRCDAHCYDAHEPECVCICGGANHGAGLQRATDNTRALAEVWLEDLSRKIGQPILRWEMPGAQLPLLEGGEEALA